MKTIKTERELRSSPVFQEPARDLDCGKGIWERPPLGVRYPKVSTEERPSMRVFSEEIQSLLITVWNYQDIGGWLNIVGRRFKKAVPTWAE